MIEKLLLTSLAFVVCKFCCLFDVAFVFLPAKHAFRVTSKDLTKGKSLILQANDQHHKKQWLNALQSVAPNIVKTSTSSTSIPEVNGEEEATGQ